VTEGLEWRRGLRKNLLTLGTRFYVDLCCVLKVRDFSGQQKSTWTPFSRKSTWAPDFIGEGAYMLKGMMLCVGDGGGVKKMRSEELLK
jgi:hypothetical protein